LNEFLKEIYSQPQALLDTLNYIKKNYQVQFQNLRELFKEGTLARVIFTGMGSSFFSSYVPYYILNPNGINAEMRESGEFLLYSFPEAPKSFSNDTALVLISQSGESGEIAQMLDKISTMENPPYTIGITNSPKSTLETKTKIVFLTNAGEETSVTSKSYTCTLFLLYIFAKNLVSDFFSNNKAIIELEDLIKEVKTFLEDIEKIDIFYNNLLSFYGSDIECLEILSRGPSLATCYQAALNFKEIVKNYSEANPCSTFRHGGIECLNINSKLIIISSDERNFKLNIDLINQEYDSSDKLLNESPKIISFKHNIHNPFLAPIMEIIILQLFFYKIAEKNNLVPGEFGFSSKVTRDV
jgi:glucosamine--fructose-6-phosphate aminotransferase (isomerizing)